MTHAPALGAAESGERSGLSRAVHHRLAANRFVYDFIQRAAGASMVHRQVAPWLRLAPGVRMLDVGGGTGALRPLTGPGVRHVCLDLERAKLQGYVAKFEDARPLQADAAALPILSASVEAVALALVTHHLTDADLAGVLGEVDRVLAPGGVLVLYDAVWDPSRVAGRLLWRLDRGSNPRTRLQLSTMLTSYFDILERREFAVLHRYAAFLCGRRGVRTPS